EQMLQQALLQSRLEAQGHGGGQLGAPPFPGAPLLGGQRGGAALYPGGSPSRLGEVEEQEAVLAQIQAQAEQEQLARAVSASLGQGPPAAASRAGRPAPLGEDDELRRALAVSKQEGASVQQAAVDELRAPVQEEEARQRRLLREQQAAELEESLRIDREPAPPLPSAAPSAAAAAPAPARPLPPEPAASEPGRLEVLVRLPDGRRLRRGFRQQDLIGALYDFIECESGGALAVGSYQLVSTMPRRVFSDRGVTLAAAGLAGSCALLVEATDA
ncbi:unnamed protein product, partial [Prorocentrum cordatum]